MYLRGNINPHEAYTKDKLEQVLSIAEKESKKVFAFVKLLNVGALRI